MSAFRPYVDEESFRYPLDVGKKALNATNSSSLVEDHSDSFEFLDLDEFVAGKSQLSAVGLSISRFYTRMLVSQPFEVSRFLLQVGEWSDDRQNPQSESNYEDYDFTNEDASSSDEEVDYFVDVRDFATGDESRSSLLPAKPKKKVKPSKSRDVRLFKPNSGNQSLFPEAIQVTSGPYIFGVMSAMCDKEGVFSMWRALNASCLCRAASGVVNAWITSFLAGSLNLPDPQFVDTLQVVDPMRLILLSTAGCALTAALLTPLHMIRARLVATSMTQPDRPRSLRWSLLDIVRRGQLMSPWWVIFPTSLAATVNHAVLTTAPTVLGRLGRIDSFSAPKLYQFSQLVAQLLALVVKMPLETMAARAQLKACHVSARTLVVKPLEYKGVLATLWGILTGETSVFTLYRGWRSEVLGLLGEWGYDALNEGRPLEQEKF